MTKHLRMVLAGVLLAVCCVCSARPATGGEEDVYTLLSTKPLGQALEEVRALAGAVLKETPYKMHATPMILDRLVCEGFLHLPQNVIDSARGAHIVLADKDRKARGGVLIVPVVKDLAGALAQVQTQALSFEPQPQGCYKITPLGRVKAFYLAPAAGDWAVIARNLETAQGIAEWLKDWQPPVTAHTLTLSMEAGRFYAAYQSEIDQIGARMDRAVDAVAEAQKKRGKPLPASELALQKMMAQMYGELGVKFMRSTDRIVVNADASITGLQVRAELVPVKGLAMDKLANLCAPVQEDAENTRLLALLPADSFSVATMAFPLPLLKTVERNLATLAASAKTKGVAPEMVKLLENGQQLMALVRQTHDKGCVYSYGLSKSGGIRYVAVSLDKPGSEKKNAEAHAVMKEMLSTIKGLGGQNISVGMEDRKIGAVDVLAITIRTQPMAGVPMPAVAQMFLNEAWREQTYLLGWYKDHCIVAGGPQAAEDFEAVMKRIDGAAGELPAQYTKDFAAAKERNLCYGAIYPNELLRQAMGVMQPMLTSLPPQFSQAITDAVGALPETSAPLTFGSAASADGFSLSLNIPVAAVDKAVEEGVKAVMLIQIQQQQMQKKMLDENSGSWK